MTDKRRPTTADRRPQTADGRPQTADGRPQTDDGRTNGVVHRPSSSVHRHWDVLIFFLVSLALYVATAAPSVATVFDDSLEFHVVLPTLGIAHPSGYPLYTLLGKLFITLAPFRDPAGRANWLSALAAALTVAVLYLVARRFAGSRWAAAVATVAFALSPAWWSQAVLAEVYALHGLLMIGFVYLLLRWEQVGGWGLGVGDQSSVLSRQSSVVKRQASSVEHQASAGGSQRSADGAQPSTFHLPLSTPDAGLTAAALAFGLGMAHHRMIALLLPAALVFIFWTEPRLLRQPRRWILPIAAGLAPLLLYAYLPLRGRAVSSLDGTFVPTLTGTLDWVTARAYSGFLSGNPFGVARDAGFFVGLLFTQFGALPLLAGVVGLLNGWRYAVRRYVFLILATAAAGAFGVSYKVQDIDVFLIPVFMLIALWIALGLGPFFDSAQIAAVSLGRALRLPRGLRPWVLGGVSLLVSGILLIEPINAAGGDWAKRNQSRSWGVYDYGQDMLMNVAPGGRVVGLLGETTLLRYFRDVLGQRPDITVVPADRAADRFAAVDAALAAGIPVYLTRDLPGAAARYSLDAAGPLIAVSPKATPGTAPTGQPVGPGILMTDAQAAVRRTHAGAVVRVSPTWVATEPIQEELKVSARLLDAAGKQVFQDDRVPVHFTYPTTAWAPGEIVRDNYDLALPAGAAAGAYRVLLILYRAADGSEVGRVERPASTPR